MIRYILAIIGYTISIGCIIMIVATPFWNYYIIRQEIKNFRK